MTATLFTNARLIDPEAQTDTIGSLLVRDGVIEGINPDTPEGASVIDCNGRALAPGLIDWGVKIGEPGERHKESFRSAGLAAAAGGVTTIVAGPDTLPPIDTPESLEFVTRRAADAPVNRVIAPPGRGVAQWETCPHRCRVDRERNRRTSPSTPRPTPAPCRPRRTPTPASLWPTPASCAGATGPTGP